jgi:hypothetical protein
LIIEPLDEPECFINQATAPLDNLRYVFSGETPQWKSPFYYLIV